MTGTDNVSGAAHASVGATSSETDASAGSGDASACAAEWTALGLLLLLLGAYQAWLHPARRFGMFHDDTLYFSSAQSLAEGRGYRIPSLPGEPPQSKYPVFYPWLLSWVWRLQPSFPANVGAAVWISTAFGGAYLFAAHRLVRSLGGMGRGTAIGIAALCAFHPIFLYLAGAILSDLPFSALALGGMVAADAGLRERARPAILAGAGILLGLSIATRTLGAAILAGVIACALHRGFWRRAIVLAALAAPFALAAAAAGAPGPAPGGPPGWRQTWLYYTAYGQFWRLCVPSLPVLWTMLLANLRYWLDGPATYCLFPTLGGDASFAGGLLQVTLTAGILAGVVRQARGREWKLIHFAFAAYSAAIWLWNYPLMDRFLLPFLPLFYAGLWVEGRHFVELLRRPARSAAERGIAIGLGLGLLALGVLAAEDYLFGFRTQLRPMAQKRSALDREKQEAFAWIRSNTPSDGRFLAYEDAYLYLHTRRKAIRPMAFSTAAFYLKDESILDRELSLIQEVAQGIGARYWLVAEDDWAMETGGPLIHRRVAELQAGLPVLFTSSGGRVRVFQLDAGSRLSSPLTMVAALTPRHEAGP